MLASQRRSQILELITRNQFISVTELASSLNASEATIRRDLNALQKEHKLERTHGGAAAIEPSRSEVKMDEKQTLLVHEKMAIAQRAFALIKANQTIILDAGSTTQFLAKLIGSSHMPLTILTNATTHCNELTKNPNVECFLLGGKMRPNTLACVGSMAIAQLSHFKADIAFLGVNGISERGELSTADIEEALMKRTMKERASTVVVLSDHSKFQKQWFCVFATADEVDMVICDDAIPNHVMEAFKKMYHLEIVKVG